MFQKSMLTVQLCSHIVFHPLKLCLLFTFLLDINEKSVMKPVYSERLLSETEVSVDAETAVVMSNIIKLEQIHSTL